MIAEKRINPRIIEYDGTSQLVHNEESFKECCLQFILKFPLPIFPRSIHFSTEDICSNCIRKCENCSDKLNAYFVKAGSFVNFSKQRKIARGGFGLVYEGQWKGRPAAVKCVRIMDIKRQRTVREAFQDLQKNIKEYRNQLASSGSGILIPHAVLRQQNQYFDGKF